MRATIKQRSSDWIIVIYRSLQVVKINDLYKLETAKFIDQFSDDSLPESLFYSSNFRSPSLHSNI